MKKVVIGMMISIIMLAVIMSPAYAAPSAKSHGNQNAAGSVTSQVTTEATPAPETVVAPANGAPSLEVRYALVESKVNLMIGVMNALIDLVSVPDAAKDDLRGLIAEMNTDLAALNTYVIANDSRGFNACIKDTLQPDMLNASKTIKDDTKLFKDWGVTKEDVKQLKNDSKQLREEYSVGAHVSAVASAKKDNSQDTQAYLNKAGIKTQAKEAKAEAKAENSHKKGTIESPQPEAGDT